MREKPSAAGKALAGVTAPTCVIATAEALSTSTDQLELAAPGCVVAATEMTWRPAEGLPMVPSPGPELPAEATTVVPSSAAFEAATADASSGPPAPPKLKLMTCATGFGCIVTEKGETASSMPRMVEELTHEPVPVQTL